MMFSIIIPVYNGEKTIAKTINSVLNQNYNNYEIIVVDDGSVDQTKSIIDEYGERIKYIFQENNKQGSARNKGLEIARGDYIIFVDSDDIIESNLLESLSNKICFGESDLIFYGYRRVDEAGQLKEKIEVQKEIVKYINSQDNRRLFLEASPCFMAYSLSFLKRNNILFMESYSFEDIDFAIRCSYYAKTADYIEGDYYVYYIREDSTVRTNTSIINLDVIPVFDNTRKELSKHSEFNAYDELEFCALKYIAFEARFRTIVSNDSKSIKMSVLESLDSYLGKHYPAISNNVYKNEISIVKRIVIKVMDSKAHGLVEKMYVLISGLFMKNK